MRINTVALSNFRNYEKLSLSLEAGLNLFVGENAQGKTNLLEAVFLCALGRSHRTKGDAEMIQHGYDTAKVGLNFQDIIGKREIEVEIARHTKKRVKIDGKLIARSAEQMGVFNAVIFSPEDLSLVKDGPSERRRFIDMELSQMRPLYCYALQCYMRALRQRNALLKLEKPKDELLYLWESQMAENAAKIAAWRAAFVERLNDLACQIHTRVCRDKETLTVEYESCIKEKLDIDEYTAEYLKQLKRHRESDLKRSVTTFGVHREDLSVLINGRSARLFASQGQQRTAALSLKLSEIAMVMELTKNEPVVLLDDVLSELDAYRRELLFSAVQGAQTLITCTGAEGYMPKADKAYRVVDGRIE